MSRGWTLLLCAYLMAWVPLGFANELLTALPSLGWRGASAIAELTFHGAGTVLCATAGWMLHGRAPAAGAAARAAIIVSAAAALQSLFWTTLPRQVAPGERLPIAVLTCVHAGFWLLMLRRAPVRRS